MKVLPTIVASPGRDLALELSAFDGADRIPNRDAFGFYFSTRQSPDAGRTRVNVIFSGTVMVVRPDAFGLPPLDDRESAFRTFAEAAIGDFLDDAGLPPPTPSGVSPATIDCFSPHFQAWRDRDPANDDAIQAYLFAHARWAWKFGHETWTLGPSDLLRLNQPFKHVMRIVALYQGEAWATEDASPSSVTIKPTREFLREQVVTRNPIAVTAPEPSAVPPENSPADFVFVDEARVAELRRLDTAAFDLRKVVALCEELNQCYRGQCYHAVAALTRALMDHVPPIFGVTSFAEVTNNYAGSKSFKDCMKRLEGARKIADFHLHTQIRSREDLPTRVQVNFSSEVDVLLGEVLRIALPSPPSASGGTTP